jgi:hypothetical protein
MNILFISVLLTINISIFLISFLLKSPESTLSYYITWIWLSILCSFNWILSSLVFVSKNNNKKTETGSFFSILPSINISFFVYSCVSFVLVLIFYLNILSPIHLSLQVLALGITILIILFTGFALIGNQSSTHSYIHKSDLLNQLLILENGTDEKKIKEIILEISNFISNKLRHPSKLDQTQLSVILEKLNDQKKKDISVYKDIFNSIKKL